MSFGEKILDYKEEIITDLAELIAIQSITGIQEGCKEALDWMMKKAISFGLKADSIDNEACHVELGEGGKLCGILAHLDVVPEGNNWDSLPFELSIGDNGYMYGRGVADDKGAALINLYCLRALKENGVTRSSPDWGSSSSRSTLRRFTREGVPVLNRRRETPISLSAPESPTAGKVPSGPEEKQLSPT